MLQRSGRALTRVVLPVLLVALVATLPGAVPQADDLAPVARQRFACHGVTHGQVGGQDPTYTRKKLSDHPNDRRVCRATWLPSPRRYFVPQGLAETVGTAWVSGFRYSPGYGDRPCRLTQLTLRTGQLRAVRTRIVGAVGERPATFCRHGGGIAQEGRRLWIAEKNRLWLVDPSRVAADGLTVRAERVWRVEEPVRGSSVVLSGGRIGLVPFVQGGSSAIHWFDRAAMKRRGVLELAARDQGRRQLGSVARTPVPSDVQGAAIGPDHRLYLTRSNLACGELWSPGRRRIALVPGAEGLDFDAAGRRLWVVSESGSWPYARSRKPFTAGVSAFEWPGLLRGARSHCRF